MTCPKCRGGGRDLAALPIKAKVPGTIFGLDHVKLVQPFCPVCGGTGKRIEEGVDNGN